MTHTTYEEDNLIDRAEKLGLDSLIKIIGRLDSLIDEEKGEKEAAVERLETEIEDLRRQIAEQ